MSNFRTQYVCTECSGITPKLMGKCPHCNKWNTLIEEVVEKTPSQKSVNRYKGYSVSDEKIEDLSQVLAEDYQRMPTGINELDRVLGGGLVDGGVILLGGDPGVGKSTLLLQTISRLAQEHKTLYITGEESKEQIALRGRRLELPLKGINIYSEIELEKIIDSIKRIKPKFVVVDSIQTVFTNALTSSPGSVTQIKDCAARLNRTIKELGSTIVIVCHVTKDGELAGPRALEHIVDTVLYFEGDKNNQYRMIRATKNRFGSVNEVGVFKMERRGLSEVKDPAGVFLGGRTASIGSVIYVTQEGNRSILTEVQALLDKTPLPNPIRRSIGMDLNRLQMLCAVMNKYFKSNIYTYNVFVSLVGGLKFDDTGIDLPALIAMLSSIQNIQVGTDVASFGEIGLNGEVRPVQNAEGRIRESARMGIKTILTPVIDKAILKELRNEKIEIRQCASIVDVVKHMGWMR